MGREGVIPLRRSPGPYEGEIYGWKCTLCECFWKIYQNTHHLEDCPNNTNGSQTR